MGIWHRQGKNLKGNGCHDNQNMSKSYVGKNRQHMIKLPWQPIISPFTNKI